MRICIDLDGVICKLRLPNQNYDDIEPVNGAVEKIKSLKKNGHYIILYTSRHMKTCNGNVGRILALQGISTLAWLERNNICYDEIFFGKPNADIYIDDNGFRFESWDLISTDINTLPVNKEQELLKHER